MGCQTNPKGFVITISYGAKYLVSPPVQIIKPRKYPDELKHNIIQLSNKAELDIANYHEVSDI